MYKLFLDFSQKILYGFGFGLGMSIPFYISNKIDNQQIYLIKLIKNE